MFDNIGGKIKTLATVVTWVGIIASVLSIFIFLAIDDDMFIIGLGVAVLGSLLSWASSFVLYGFGQLVENSDIIAKNMPKRERPYPNEVAKDATVFLKKEAPKKVDTEEIKNTHDLGILIEDVCPSCGEMLSFPRDMLEKEREVTCPYCDEKITYNKQ